MRRVAVFGGFQPGFGASQRRSVAASQRRGSKGSWAVNQHQGSLMSEAGKAGNAEARRA